MTVRVFTSEEVAAAIIDGNKALVQKIEELCTRVATAEAQRDEMFSLEKQYCERLGDLARLAEPVCLWVLENGVALEENIRSAAEEILDYVDAVKPN
jgi:hypothetical protein